TSSNIQSKPFIEAIQVLVNSIKELVVKAGISIDQVDVIYLTLAGAGRENDQKKIVKALLRHLPENVEVIVDHDAKGTLVAVTAGVSGMVLIAGTDFIAYTFPAQGTALSRVGGWGYLLGDEGSGYDIVRKAIATVMKSYDGRSASTKLAAL